ncbi:MAG: hypothetical protein DWQ34_19505 [Planctomycetota bacterium]|nr:MAG: hypothetical protein DWQ29_14265 [Planctomycetota bacterium]REJ89445.1 MAG: hypothetical protein DWQ34_19505 [Planctomycetota bacterium]
MFLLAGMASGAASASVSFVCWPLGLILPGLFFGFALLIAISHTIGSPSPVRRIAIVASSAVANPLAWAVLALAGGLYGAGGGVIEHVFRGGLVGGTGAFVVAIPLGVFLSEEAGIAWVALTGAALQAVTLALFSFVDAFGSASSIPSICWIVFEFVVWQAGVAGVLASQLWRGFDAA